MLQTEEIDRVVLDEREYDYRRKGDDAERKVEAAVQFSIKRLKKGCTIIAEGSAFTLEDVMESAAAHDDYIDACRHCLTGRSETMAGIINECTEKLCRDWEDELYVMYRNYLFIDSNGDYYVDLGE